MERGSGMRLSGKRADEMNAYDRFKWWIYITGLDIKYYVWDRLVVRYLIFPCPPLRRIYDRMTRIRRQWIYAHP
jgi:hypothetical protein